MVWRLEDPCGDEAGKVKYEIVPFTRGKGVDLGCGPSKAFPHFIGVDNCVDTELFGIQMKPDIVHDDCTKLGFLADGELDFVFSSHLLEHIVDYQAALAEWWRVLKVGAHLVLYLPHKALYPNIGQPGANPDHKHDFMPGDIVDAMEAIAYESEPFDLLVNETRAQEREYSFLQVYRKLPVGQSIECSYTRKRPDKKACVVRYGGIGDCLQAANLFPELKRQGYHITLMTVPTGELVLRHDPHVDEWVVQDPDQVPNHHLSEFWKVQRAKFDLWINLSESVEGTLLAIPGRANHGWPDAMRRKYLGLNYLQFMSELAQIPYRAEARFYPTPDERRAAQEMLKGIEARLQPDFRPPMRAARKMYFVMWCLAGSSVHKVYPHQDDVIANLLAARDDIVVIMVGDMVCKVLEQGWEDNPRVVCTSGSFNPRQTMALAQQVDLVIGPETGMLNATAFDDFPAKVVLLSHSSVENLTRDWLNTYSLTPASTPCYPCHRLHYTREFCPHDEETHAAACQHDIAPRRVFEAIMRAYDEAQELRRALQL